MAHALDFGYRHIDTAEMTATSPRWATPCAPRDSTAPTCSSRASSTTASTGPATRRAFEATLLELDLDYVDLFLIHWPLPTLYDGDFVSTWKVLEACRRDGRARSIGVSSFQVEHLERLAAAADVIPAVNQIELHPYFHNDEVHRYGQDVGIATEAWSPLAQGAVLGDPAVCAIAERVDRTPAQVVLRWHLQHGHIVFPKSTTPARIAENFAVFDFDLEPEDVQRIDALDKGEAGRIGPNPEVFAYVAA